MVVVYMYMVKHVKGVYVHTCVYSGDTRSWENCSCCSGNLGIVVAKLKVGVVKQESVSFADTIAIASA